MVAASSEIIGLGRVGVIARLAIEPRQGQHGLGRGAGDRRWLVPRRTDGLDPLGEGGERQSPEAGALELAVEGAQLRGVGGRLRGRGRRRRGGGAGAGCCATAAPASSRPAPRAIQYFMDTGDLTKRGDLMNATS